MSTCFNALVQNAAFLMQLTALFNAVCLYNACIYIFFYVRDISNVCCSNASGFYAMCMVY